MLNEQVFETERFTTEPFSTVTIGSAAEKAAANETVDHSLQATGRLSRRNRRRALFTPSPLGGWKVRMW